MLDHPPVRRADIELFLKELAKYSAGPARLFLVGRTTLTFEEVVPDTLDIELVVEVAGAERRALYGLIREAGTALEINIAEAPPEERIPLPAGYASRHIPVGRFGQLDVYHFDLYSVTLSQLARGREQDYHDALAMLRAHRIEWTALKSYFKEIRPQVGLKSLNQDPLAFQMNFNALEDKWRVSGGHP